jgi:hypothetical protein
MGGCAGRRIVVAWRDVGVSASWPAKAGAFAYDSKTGKYTKLYGQVEITCGARYFV